MIATFNDKDLEKLYYTGKKAKKIPADIVKVVLRKLDIIRESKDINDLKVPPANRLEALKGNLKGFYSIRVNRQFRIIFKWQNDTAYDVSLIDYH
ncbi:MAG: type II toxin-antitoxin system RelE/ParE family toxin [Planctomycetota bacterium]|jgi:proteic killer suppression protein